MLVGCDVPNDPKQTSSGKKNVSLVKSGCTVQQQLNLTWTQLGEDDMSCQKQFKLKGHALPAQC